ncbi:molybdate transporter 1 [Perilla frutescens var. hirtella]|nr:molybdate transporter 1 [Perilla frutescens var. hirtella]
MESSQGHNPDSDPTRISIPSPSHVAEKLWRNLIFRSKWAKLNGAMGDLGTYIPIILALTLAKNLDLGTTLIFTGAYNFVTGAIYGVPMPVQPMKSIAVFGIPEVMAAGICTAAVLLILGATRLMQVVYK